MLNQELNELRARALQLEFELSIVPPEDPRSLVIHRENGKKLQDIYERISDLEREVKYER